jgi:cyclic-di-GMP-binding biofilm dispersal mediator protein
MAKKKVLIVGGSRGIGYALAWHFKKIRKDDVCIVARTAEEVELAGKTLRAKWFQGDIREADICEKSRELLGGLDIVISTAGVFEMTDVPGVSGTISPLDFLNINVLGPFRICKSAAKILAHGGSIVLFSGGGVGGPDVGKDCSALYAASKAAVVQLTECLAREHPELRINAVAPGRVATKMRDGIGSTPAGTIHCVDWLCSDEAKNVTGRLVSVTRDGGVWTSRELGEDWGKLRRLMP